MKKTVLLLITLLILVPGFVCAFELQGLQFGLGNVVVLNAEPVTVSPAPSPSAAMLGFSVPMMITDLFYFEPGLRVFALNVVLNVQESGTYKPVPAAIETPDRIGVLAMELRPEFGLLFSPDSSIDLGVTIAPVVMMKFPLTATDSAGETEMTAVREYYFSGGRYLNLYAGAFFGWNVYDDLSLRIKVGTDLPIYHLWDGEEIAFYDQMMIMPEISLLWRF